MSRILIVNPNSDQACTAGIAASVAPFDHAREMQCITLPDGPPAILSWRDWHGVVEKLCRVVGEQHADAYVIACASDPGIEAVRAVTTSPVLGVFRCAVAGAVARAERFGVIAIVEASKARHLAALRAMGLEGRLAAEVALDVAMSVLLDPAAARARLIAAGRSLVEAGAGAVVLGCTGMAHHRGVVEQAIGVPVIEPCQAAAVQAILATRTAEFFRAFAPSATSMAANA